MVAVSSTTSSGIYTSQINKNSGSASKSLGALASGKSINKASDDAAGLAIASILQSDVSTLKQASRNLVQGTAVLQTADAGLEQAGNILNRMKELSTRASSGGLDSNSQTAINDEYQNLKTELDGLSTSTTFNGQNLLDGSYNKSFQSGADATNTVTADLSSVDVSATGLGLTAGVGASATALSSSTSAQATSAELDTAINNLSSYRSQVGATLSQFSTQGEVVDTESESAQAAQSAISDADIAKEQNDFTSSKLLTELSIAAAAQGNKASSSLLKLVR